MPFEPTPNLDQEIATLAYRYWEQEGCPENRSVQNWERAEREIHERRNSSIPDPLAPGGIPNDTGASARWANRRDQERSSSACSVAASGTSA